MHHNAPKHCTMYDMVALRNNYILLTLQSISGCLSHACKMGNQTDQSKSSTSSDTAILIGQFDLPFYVHGTKARREEKRSEKKWRLETGDC